MLKPPKVMPENFQFDVLFSHSAKDKSEVRPLAELLRIWSTVTRMPIEQCDDGQRKEKHDDVEAAAVQWPQVVSPLLDR